MVGMRTIDVVFNNYESVDIVSLIDLCDNHVNDCLLVAQTVALESDPPSPLPCLYGNFLITQLSFLKTQFISELMKKIQNVRLTFSLRLILYNAMSFEG